MAEITALRFGLHGETFNAYGASGLLQDIPKGGNQVIDHVRATDVVSAGSAHFGEVHVYAAQQDINRLSSAGYRDDGGIFSLRDPLRAIDFGAHGIDSFVPDSKALGHSVISPECELRYRAHHGMIDRYRSDIMDLRTGLSASWEIPKLAAESGLALGRAAAHEITQAVHAVEHGAQYVAHEAAQGEHAVERGAQHAVNSVERTAQSVAHTIHDDVLQGVHAMEHAVSQGIHTVEHGAQYVAHEAAQDARAAEHGVQHATQTVEHTVRNVAHTVGGNVSQGVRATEHTFSQDIRAVEHAAQSLASGASQAFDTLRHPGSWLDDKPAAATTPRLDKAAHPDHQLYQQARTAVHRLDAEHQRMPDQRSGNLAAALVVAARREGLNQVDHAVLSDNASQAFAVQGELSSMFKRVAGVQTAEAVATPIGTSSAAWQQIMQAKQPDHALAAPQLQQQQHEWQPAQQNASPAPPM